MGARRPDAAAAYRTRERRGSEGRFRTGLRRLQRGVIGAAAGQFAPHIPDPLPDKSIDPLALGGSFASLRMKADGIDGSARLDGWRGVAAVGPSHGPQRDFARLRS